MARTVMAPQQGDSEAGVVKRAPVFAEQQTSKVNQRGRERTWAKAGAGPEEGQPRPSPAQAPPRAARPRGSRKRGGGGRAKPTSASPRLGKPVAGPRCPAEPAASAPRPGRGHGDSAPLATGRPRARAGIAASAAERAGPGPRLPAPPRLPGPGLRAGGERSRQSEDARAVGGGGEDDGEWRRGVRGAGVGRAVGVRRLSKVPRAVRCAKGRTAQALAGPGRLKVRPRDSEEVPGMAQRGGALARTPGVESR